MADLENLKRIVGRDKDGHRRVYALTHRGLLRRLNVRPEYYRDTYRLKESDT